MVSEIKMIGRCTFGGNARAKNRMLGIEPFETLALSTLERVEILTRF